MNTIYDIYDSETFKLVKPDVKLTKKGTHKDLTSSRYIKIRIGAIAERFDYDALIMEFNLLKRRVETLEGRAN